MTISNPKFDFDRLLQEAIGHEDSGDHDHDCTDEEDEDEGGQFSQFEPQEYREPQRTVPTLPELKRSPSCPKKGSKPYTSLQAAPKDSTGVLQSP